MRVERLLETDVQRARQLGLSEEQISILQRYLSNKQVMNKLNAGVLAYDIKAIMHALAGISATLASANAHLGVKTAPLTKKARTWILSKLTDAIPTKIDDTLLQAIESIQDWTDTSLLPKAEKWYNIVSQKQYSKYKASVDNANHYREWRTAHKEILADSKKEADPVHKEIRKRLRELDPTNPLNVHTNKQTQNLKQWFNKKGETNNGKRIQETQKNQEQGEIP